ncbi:MAG: hypothetical protein HPY45_14915 [Anaerolineae bacterium]|nr:hypothetical protein [Anaerolineae bacterium]
MSIPRLYAAAAETDITPQGTPMLCAEFAPRRAQGVHTPLMSRALLLEDGQTRLVLLTLDLYGLEKTAADALAQAAADAAGVSPEAVMIVCTHTRAAPVTAHVAGCPEADTGYLQRLAEPIADCVQQAQQALQPAALGLGSVHLPHLVHNCRLLTRNYKAVSTRLPLPENEVLHPEGETDPYIRVITVRDGRGFPICLVWHLAADLPAGRGDRISAAVPGSVQAAVDQRLGKHLPCLYLGGCGGDVTATLDAEHTARWLTDAVLAASFETPGDAHIRLDACAETVILPARDVSQFWDEADITLKYPAVLSLLGDESEWLRRTAKPAWHASLRLFCLGETALAGLPGMPFVAFAQHIQAHSPFRHTLVVGNAHTHLGWIPTQQAFDGGGLEVWASRSSRLERGAGEFLAWHTVRLLSALSTASFKEKDYA